MIWHKGEGQDSRSIWSQYRQHNIKHCFKKVFSNMHGQHGQNSWPCHCCVIYFTATETASGWAISPTQMLFQRAHYCAQQIRQSTRITWADVRFRNREELLGQVSSWGLKLGHSLLKLSSGLALKIYFQQIFWDSTLWGSPKRVKWLKQHCITTRFYITLLHNKF